METSANISMSEQKAISITNIIKQFRQRLFGFVRGRVSNTEDAEDILQDVWYQLSNLTDIDDLDNVSAWLYQVARNKITDRSRKKTNLALEEYVYENDEGEFNFKEILLLDDSNNAELAFFKEIFWKEFQVALDELPPNQREVFLLNEMEDMTLQQIADQKGENLKTIISRKGYAVKHLRNKLNYLYEELNS
ncbi:RNA polymerase, sigma-24 subunit, ECF subfamily [Paludibacter propionicigenes WB4]|uniref:RNA polymerase, sigma-24 subunit, ECF subfamily n=1 Tax=Paludibacter propionicigenes (strain DSM 17365 / JCM 13257 / WB4) TaxID=694427 RepID=E4T7I0_PALPW|nr:sigma-70 family RNA polymerase sigma factor [Paludibacter propionicigenes]ADQ80674.1 RNA polymerase, sigma-24 subunit, ECF subfamily [Paludibacter propionicigenes WB4]